MLKTKTITLKIRVRAEEHNVLADALAGDVEKILREHHKVTGARATSAKVNGREMLALRSRKVGR
jgi:hypothetical protein